MTNDKRLNHRTSVGRRPEDAIFDDKEGRIDWERKQKGRRQGRQVVDPAVEELEEQLDRAIHQNKRKKSAKKKRRELVYDESRERVVVKRKRKPSRQVTDAWSDDYDY